MENVLIVKLSAIGDVIHALPVAHAIKETYPAAHLTWVVEPPAYELLTAVPCIDEIVLFRKKDFKTIHGFKENFWPLRRQLKTRAYDVSLDLQGLFKSAAVVKTAGAKKRFGTCNMRELSDWVSKPVIGANAHGHIVERYLDVARAVGCTVNEVVFPLTVSTSTAQAADKILAEAGMKCQNPYVVLAVGANWPNKRWPAQYYVALIDWLYRAELIPVLIGGGAVDENIAAAIEQKAEIPPVNIIGKTSLLELAHILRQAKAVVGGDTGPVHLAAGLKVPTVMLMGPTDANRNGPYGQPDNAIEADRPCKYCWHRACPKGIDCLAVIHPEQVESKIKSLLAPQNKLYDVKP